MPAKSAVPAVGRRRLKPEEGIWPLLPGLFWISGFRQGLFWGALAAVSYWLLPLPVFVLRKFFPKKALGLSVFLLLAAAAQTAWNRFGFPPYWIFSVFLLAAPAGVPEKRGLFSEKKKLEWPSGCWTQGLFLVAVSGSLGLFREIMAGFLRVDFFAHVSGVFFLMAGFFLIAQAFLKEKTAAHV